STEQLERLLPAWRKEPRGLAQLRAFISWALGLVSSARCQYLDKRCASIIGPRAPIAWLNGYNHAVVSVLFISGWPFSASLAFVRVGSSAWSGGICGLRRR